MNVTRRALLASLLIALIVAAGYALAAIPNVEVVTFLVFVAGYLLGPVTGAVVGAVSIGGHSLFNVYGAAVPPVLAAQVICYALVGVCGALLGPVICGVRPPVLAGVLSGFVGFTMVLVFQLAVGLASYLAFTSESPLWPYLWGGLAFTFVQLVWNAALFAAAARPTLSVLRRHRAELRGTAV